MTFTVTVPSLEALHEFAFKAGEVLREGVRTLPEDREYRTAVVRLYLDNKDMVADERALFLFAAGAVRLLSALFDALPASSPLFGKVVAVMNMPGYHFACDGARWLSEMRLDDAPPIRFSDFYLTVKRES